MEAAVREPSEVVRASLELSKGDDNPNRVARNVLHDLRSAGFDIRHSASSLLPNEISAEDRRALMIGRAACRLLVVKGQTALPDQVSQAGDRLGVLIQRLPSLNASRCSETIRHSMP
jgi:hypothetical protein